MEFGVGVSNILKFIRVDCYWRATYRNERYVVVDDPTKPHNGLDRLKTPNFAVKIGAEFKF